ncbi:gp53-like domain-containing protein [Bacillus sp. T33-2]|uniref:gp53-like domain-containing protein n=1 Tax=Bacillus sp. T33-2 TaxID=2054168 RepID=UPI000C76AD4F|nr:hypothetical protein [Bacillus sp. T33-2]PLR93186.1 hypothetical protein CVD19_19455 [Bacillus sp. T33-2]
MPQISFPFDSGAGASITEQQWSKMAQHWLNTGIIKNELNDLHVFADATGMQVKVSPGVAWIKGHYYESTEYVVLPIAAADSVNPRIDRVILRLDWTNNNIQLAVLQGVPAASPIAPALAQNSARWEIALAQIRVNANVPTIVQGTETDERKYTWESAYPGDLKSSGWTKLPNGLILQWGFLDLTGLTANSWVSRQINFPVTFPAQCFNVFTDMYASAGAYGQANNGNALKHAFTAYVKPESAGNATVVWFAIGI